MGTHRLATKLFVLLFLPMLAQLKWRTAVSARHHWRVLHPASLVQGKGDAQNSRSLWFPLTVHHFHTL